MYVCTDNYVILNHIEFTFLQKTDVLEVLSVSMSLCTSAIKYSHNGVGWGARNEVKLHSTRAGSWGPKDLRTPQGATEGSDEFPSKWNIYVGEFSLHELEAPSSRGPGGL
jgi:hypothetical protein